MFEHIQRGGIKTNVGFAREVIPIRINVVRLVVLIRLLQGLAVKVHLLVHDPQAVAGNPDNALDEGLLDVDRVTEDNDVAALDRFIGQQILAHRAGGGVTQLVHQEVIADQQRVLHRAGGDDERLHQRGGAE